MCKRKRIKLSNDKKKFVPETFLENGFPITKLHSIALREGNSKQPVYQIHKWWARRLGSVFRVLLISSTLDPYDTHENLWAKYFNGHSMEDKVILDPMMGGGTSVVEALRLGCKVIGCDINPVAWFVTKKEIEWFDAREIDETYQKLKDKVGTQIKRYYDTRCSRNHQCQSVYTIWIRVITCESCKKSSDLVSSTVIRDDGKTRVYHCPSCSGIFYTTEKGSIVRCNTCKSKFSLEYKTASRGRFACPLCGHQQQIIDSIKKQNKLLPTRMICVEFDCKMCGRGFKKPSRTDLVAFQLAESELIKNWKRLPFPKQKISENHLSDRRPKSHGFAYYYQLFNPRQLLSLSLLLKEIKKIKNKDSREYFLLAFSSCLETNNSLCKYETNWGKISALFGLPAYYVPERYGENNLFGNGRGSFPRAFQKMKRGKMFTEKNYQALDRKLDEQSKKITCIKRNIIAATSKKHPELSVPDQPQLLCQDSSDLPLASKTVDAVITDPPYFDIINYSYLADFFYVWLRLGLKTEYDCFSNTSSTSKNEIVLKNSTGEEHKKYAQRLTLVFTECNRVLKDNGLMVFTFHHSKEWAWKILRDVLIESGFVVTASHVIRSEGRTGYRSRRGSTGYDVLIVARKDSKYNASKINYSQIQNDCLRNLKIFKQSSVELDPSDVFTTIMSKYIQSDDKTSHRIMDNLKEISANLIFKTQIRIKKSEDQERLAKRV